MEKFLPQSTPQRPPDQVIGANQGWIEHGKGRRGSGTLRIIALIRGKLDGWEFRGSTVTGDPHQLLNLVLQGHKFTETSVREKGQPRRSRRSR